MLEETAKTKMCPHMLLSMKISILAIGQVPSINAQDYENCIDVAAKSGAELCQGSRCMFWDEWTKREFETTTWYEAAEEVEPEGEGWKKQYSATRHVTHSGPVNIHQAWIRTVSTGSGECGLKWQAE